MTWDIDAEREFWRRRCRDSFYWFFRYAYGYDFNPKGRLSNRPWFHDPTHKLACDWFEYHCHAWLDDRAHGRNKPRKLMIVVPRDWGKTTLFTQAGQTWLHIHDPELSTYTGCETQGRAREILSAIKSVISGQDIYSRFAWLYGSQRHPKRTWHSNNVTTAARTNLTRRDASFGTWAVESGMVGLHPDAGFFDDPNTYEKMASKLDWLDMVCQHLDTLIPVFQSDALWCLTATRYGVGDHIGRSISHEGCGSVTGMPMPGVTVEPDGIWHVFYLDAIDERTTPAKLVMPQIWSPDRIKSFERRNPLKFWAQVRNNPVRSPHNTLHRDRAERMVVEPSTVDLKTLRVSIHLDTAFKNLRRKSRGDMNVISVVGHRTDGSGKCVFLGSKYSNNWESKQFGEQLVKVVQEWRPKVKRLSCVTDEEEIGGKPGLWPAFINNIFKTAKIDCPRLLILGRPNNAAKIRRLEEAAAMWSDGRMDLLRGAEGLDYLIDQMCTIGMSDYDDFADATADCFHREVYSAVWNVKSEASAAQTGNPFDDVLKPGRKGDDAAEEIAKMTMEREEALLMGGYDVIQP